MKAAPIALLAKGDINQAIEKAVTVCRVTHNNNIALAGAAAVAAATAAAMKEGADLYDVVKASLYGAVKGDQMGREQGATLAGASMEARIRWAVSVAMTQESLDEAIDELADYIGSGLMAVEAVPAAIGLCVAAGGNTVDAICAAVNIGNDTDTVATMVGGILGAYEGAEVFPKQYLTIIRDNNRIDIERLAAEIVESVKKEEGYV